MLRALSDAAYRALAWVSVTTCAAATGVRISWCGLAWHLRWRLWIAVADAALRWREDRHCERSAGRWE